VGDAVCQELGQTRRRTWDGRYDIGIIAGSANMGFGRLFASELANNSDGAAYHIVVPVAHTSMVFSPLATRQVVKFLKDGKFDHGGSKVPLWCCSLLFGQALKLAK
jgi:hypothetical protein